jgi:glycosyltransferase involved in cell wall biosynthesis
MIGTVARISIGIPAFNEARYIEEAINSVFG